MGPPLPTRPNLNFLRKRAKQLLKAHKSLNPAICDYLRKVKRFSTMSNDELFTSDITLLDVQYVLAIEYGFTSWNKLRDFILQKGETMDSQLKLTVDNIDVHLENLEPFIAASFYSFSDSPEIEAIDKLKRWARPKGLLENLEKHPIYGFNNPSPIEARRYGYEFWIKLDNCVEPEGDMRIIEFFGGFYAVCRCNHLSGIGQHWNLLTQWCQKRGLRIGTHQWLEKQIGENDEGPILDLYLPLIEK